MAKKVVTFGELMIRLQPYNYERFVQADHLEFTFGGGEANVAVSLANYGLDAAYVTKLPAHAIGQAAVNSLRRYGVDTSKITAAATVWASTSTRRALPASQRVHL
jgi:2-dehydro-3-deoxygluconokinase